MERHSEVQGPVVHDYTIPARAHYSLLVKNGQVLRVIDAEGQQVMDMVCFNAQDKSEKLSCIYSNLFNGTWRLTKGHHLFTNRANKMWTIIEDTVGLHHSGGGFCSDEINYVRFGVRGTRNCADNLTRAIEPHGLTRPDIDLDSCFNIFMNIPYDPDGKFEIRFPISRAGDYIDLMAHMDILVAISVCPGDRSPTNAYNPTSMRVILFEPPS